MASGYIVSGNDLTAIADAIRTKGKTTESLVFPNGFVSAIEGIEAGESVEQATPTITVSDVGLITASATQKAGLVAAGTKSATKQLTAQAAQTITPGTSDKTIASGRYLTGTQTIKGDSNLVAANIKKGVSIFGVSGGYAGVELNFTVVGGTSQPSSPAANTIWVNTSTSITSWCFDTQAPAKPSSGDVWLVTGTTSGASFNALKKNKIQVYPTSVYQYVNNAWVTKEAKTYQNGVWVSWRGYLYSYGNTYDSVTGGYSLHTVHSNAVLKLDADCISLNYSDYNSAYMLITSKNPVDMSKYNTINFDMIVTEHINNWGGNAVVGVSTEKLTTPANGTHNKFAALAYPTVDSVRRVVSVPINTINSAYVCIHGIMKAKIYEIYLT